MHGLSPNCVVLSDGAQQFNILVHALCWIHAERALKKLLPKNADDAAELDTVRGQLWDYYTKLKKYQETPSPETKESLTKEFDCIFGQIVKNDELTIALAKFRERKEELLRVLEYPFVPLHNNSSEQDIRNTVIKRKISGGTRSDEGRKARDIYMSLVKTCRKLKLSTWDLFGCRISGTNVVPYLPTIIRERAQLFAGP